MGRGNSIINSGIIFHREDLVNSRKYFSISFIVLFTFFSLPILMAQDEIETPKETEVLDNLAQRRVVFLCFYNETDPSLLSARAEINSVVSNFRGSVTSVYVSGSDKAEDKLRAKFDTLPEQTAVFIVVPPGRAVAKMEGKDITKQNLMQALYSSCGGGGCGSGCK